MSEAGRAVRSIHNEAPPGCGYSLEAIIALQKALEHGVADALENSETLPKKQSSASSNSRPACGNPERTSVSGRLAQTWGALLASIAKKFLGTGRSARHGA